MYIKRIILFAGCLLVLPQFAAANTLYNIYRAQNPTPTPTPVVIQKTMATAEAVPTKTSKPETPLHGAPSAIMAYVDELKEKWRLATSHCEQITDKQAKGYCATEKWKMTLESFERKKTLDLQKNWRLSQDFCNSRTSFRNYHFCNSMLRQQNNFCAQQKTNGRRIIIDLANQLMYGVKDCELKVYTRITSGKNLTPTPPGTYSIYERRGPHWMQGEWFVNMAFYFRGGYAIHDAGWRVPPFWNPEKRAVHGSHGCVNTPSKVMATVWDEFEIGDTVHVYRSLPEDIATELQQKVGTRVPFDPENPVVHMTNT